MIYNVFTPDREIYEFAIKILHKKGYSNKNVDLDKFLSFDDRTWVHYHDGGKITADKIKYSECIVSLDELVSLTPYEQDIQIGGHKVEFLEDRIKVGCREVRNEVVRAIINYDPVTTTPFKVETPNELVWDFVQKLLFSKGFNWEITRNVSYQKVGEPKYILIGERGFIMHGNRCEGIKTVYLDALVNNMFVPFNRVHKHPGYIKVDDYIINPDTASALLANLKS